MAFVRVGLDKEIMAGFNAKPIIVKARSQSLSLFPESILKIFLIDFDRLKPLNPPINLY